LDKDSKPIPAVLPLRVVLREYDWGHA